MLKKFLLFCCLLFLALSVWAQTDDDDEEGENAAIEAPAQEEEQIQGGKKKSGIKNRTFELSLVNVNVNVTNDFIAAKDIFQETAVINLDDFLSGFRLDARLAIRPLSLNFNWKDKWGFGFDIAHIDVFGNVSLSENLINLNEVNDDKFGIGAAVFADFAVPVFFHADDFRIKIRPAVYLPLFYTEPGIIFNNSGDRLSVKYDMRIYSVLNLNEIFGDDPDSLQNTFSAENIENILKNNLGFDLGLGVEYPLYSWLDLGVDIFNLPFAAARLNHYMRLHGEAYFDSSKIDIADLVDGGEIPEDAYGYPEDFEPEYLYDSSGRELFRPFKMLFYANYRPFDTGILTLIPSLGFSISNLYAEIGSIEAGIAARCDLGNIFIITLGTGYFDRNWKHSLDFVLNFRALELDIGVSVQSPDFVKSFQGAGAGVNFGIKLGW